MSNAPAAPHPALSRAVLIGTSDYERQDRLPNLRAVANNLIDLRQTLTSPATGVLSHDVCVVVDSPDSPVSFMSRLSKEAAKAEDLLLVYYAGHGLRHQTRDLLYLGVRCTDPDNLAASAVSYDDVREVVEHSPARVKLVVLDCCYSGLAIGTMSGDTVDTREIQISGTSVITSVPRNKRALSPPGERHTAFTGELISLLENGPRLPDEPLTVRTLYGSLCAAMGRRDMPTPKLASLDRGSDLLLRREPPRPVVSGPVLAEPVPVRQPREFAMAAPPSQATAPLFSATSEGVPHSSSPSRAPEPQIHDAEAARTSYLRRTLSLSAALQVAFFGSFYLALMGVMDFTTGTSTNKSGAISVAVMMGVLAAAFGAAWRWRRRMRTALRDESAPDIRTVQRLRTIKVVKVMMAAGLSLVCLLMLVVATMLAINPHAGSVRGGVVPASGAVYLVFGVMFAHALVGTMLLIRRNVRELDRKV
ncbi:caspase domain-containing protein [Lentzea sp. NPDC060358]|uniref:caspase family protein n=1 Tax=Lentzea sp. NPDC060358 TaxID=3347103 RepID=UPI003664FA29